VALETSLRQDEVKVTSCERLKNDQGGGMVIGPPTKGHDGGQNGVEELPPSHSFSFPRIRRKKEGRRAGRSWSGEGVNGSV